MKIIRNSAAMAHVLDGPIDPVVKRILIQRRSQLEGYEGYDLGDLAAFFIVETGDTVAMIEAELGFPILTNLVDGSRFGEVDFSPSCEILEDYGGVFEHVTILDDSGFGWVVLIPAAQGIDAQLLAFCRAFATRSAP